jgi:hypothetical protein
MNPRRYSVRSALLVVGSIAVAAVSNGCNSAPSEQTGKSGEALGTLLRSVTSAPADNGAVCGRNTVEVPAALADFGCTLGVEINSDPENFGSKTFTTSSNEVVQAYAWACPRSAALESAVTNAISNGTFGGPHIAMGTAGASADATSYDSCVGEPDRGWAIVLEQPLGEVVCVPPHPGGFGDVVPSSGMALSSLRSVHPFLVLCPKGGCDCPLNYIAAFNN